MLRSPIPPTEKQSSQKFFCECFLICLRFEALTISLEQYELI